LDGLVGFHSLVNRYWPVSAYLLCMGVLLAGMVAIPVRGQTPAPQVFRGGTTLVPVDVRVVDRDGKPVTDLRQDEFIVTENGRRQAVSHFSTHTFTAVETTAAASGLRPRPPHDAPLEIQSGRVFLIVLGHGAFGGPAKALEGVRHFIRERLLPQDLLAVVGWNRTTDFTTNHAAVLSLIERADRSQPSIETQLQLSKSGLAAIYGTTEIPAAAQRDIDAVFGGLTSRALADRDRTIDTLRDAARADPTRAAETSLDDFVGKHAQSMQDLGKLYAALDYLRRFDGEKQLIYISANGLILPSAEDDKDLAALATDARVVMHFIHTGGIQMSGGLRASLIQGYSASNRGPPPEPQPMQPLPAMTWQRQTARQISTLTGGMASIGGYAREALDAIDRVSRFQYLLGYSPANAVQDSTLRQIRVTVTRPGVSVQYRHAYYASPVPAPLDRRRMMTYNRITAAASFPSDVPDIGVRGAATASKPPAASAVHLELTVDPSRLTFQHVDGRNTAELELLVGCLDVRDSILQQVWKRVELSYTDDRLAAIKQSGVPVSIALPLNRPASAARSVKVVVYDYASDLVGSAIIKVQ
jgi:VWFA-related protein